MNTLILVTSTQKMDAVKFLQNADVQPEDYMAYFIYHNLIINLQTQAQT